MNTSTLKKLNTEKIRTALKVQDMASKISLASATGLSVATCGNILSELISSGEVIEAEHAASTGGRRSRQFRYNENFAYLLCIYARREGSEQSLCYRVVNLYGSETDSGIVSAHVTTDEITSLIASLIASHPRIEGISLGIPGVVDGGVISICDFDTLHDINIQSALEDAFSIPVMVENDVNCAALGFIYANNCDNDPSFAYVYYPTDGCPGVGLIVDDAILHGCTHFAGEVFHLPVTKSDDARINAANTLASIACILNPKRIALAGLSFSKADSSHIQTLLDDLIPAPHTPHVIFEPDFHNSYMRGLTTLALDAYSAIS